MDVVQSLSADFLAQKALGPGENDARAKLAWLAKRSGAVAAALRLCDSDGQDTVCMSWGVSDPQERANQSNGIDPGSGQDATQVSAPLSIALGCIDGKEAFLDLDLQGRDLSAHLDGALGSIIPTLRLVVALHLAEKALSKCEERLAVLEELGSEWLWETDEEGRFTYVSHDLSRLGLHVDTFIGRTREEIALESGADANATDWRALLQRIAQRKPFRNFFHPARRADGGRVWLRTTGAPRYDSLGCFRGYKGVSAELTDLVEQERSATLAMERLAAILSTLPDIVLEITADGCYADFVAGPSDLLAEARDHLPGRSFEEVLPPEVAALCRTALGEVLTTGTCSPVRYQLASPAGLRWFQLLGTRKPSISPTVAPTAIFVIRDITDDVQQRDELFRLGQIVHTMSNMVAIVDREQRIEWVNRAWERRTGWTLEEVLGRDLATLVRVPDSDPESAEQVTRAIMDGRPHHGTTVNVDRQGNCYWIDFNILPLPGPDGSPVGYVSVETDITAQKESQLRAALAAEEAERMRMRLKNAIETLPDGVIIWDENDRLFEVNSAYRRMYPEVAEELVPGVSQEEILRIGLARGAFPAALGREEEWIAEQRRRFADPTVDEVRRIDGRWIRRLDLRTPDGGRIAVRIDTTTSRERIAALDAANAALSEARQSLARIIESADVGTWEWEVETGGLQIGGRYAEMLGYTPEELGEPSDEVFRALVHPDDMAQLDRTEEDDFAPTPEGREMVREHELRMRHKDGSWVWILSRSAVTERTADGRHKRVVGIHLNVTDRKRLEDEINTSRAFLTEVMDASVSAIAVINADGVITYANAEAEHVLGLQASAIMGKRYDDSHWEATTVDGRLLAASEFPARRALETREIVRDARIAISWPDGQRRILLVNAAPHVGDETIVIVSFMDVTADMERASNLEQALEVAHEASHSKSTFLANMSHEIRTPLNGVLGMAEILDGLIVEPRQKEMIRTIRQSGELLLNVLNDILDMSKIEAGKMVMESIPFVPAEVARNTEALHRLRAEERGIEFEVFTNPGAEKARLGDPLRIQQILNNLLSNAVKFTEKGFVSLTVAVREGRPMTIEVTDTGIGMSPEQVSRIFDSFEQAEDGTTRRFGGTGLGMAIVRKLIELMDGDVKVTSAIGEGTSVRVTLPVGETTQEVQNAAPISDLLERVSLNGIRLLVADDSATNRVVLREMLQETGAEIVLACNGVEAVEAWERLSALGTPADLLILDISMPQLDGKGALSAIRGLDRFGAKVPAVAVTANAMAHHVTEYIMAGFDAHVPKPFRRAELLHAITTLLPPRSVGGN